jgi:hypothetical protein
MSTRSLAGRCRWRCEKRLGYHPHAEEKLLDVDYICQGYNREKTMQGFILTVAVIKDDAATLSNKRELFAVKVSDYWQRACLSMVRFYFYSSRNLEESDSKRQSPGSTCKSL